MPLWTTNSWDATVDHQLGTN